MWFNHQILRDIDAASHVSHRTVSISLVQFASNFAHRIDVIIRQIDQYCIVQCMFPRWCVSIVSLAMCVQFFTWQLCVIRVPYEVIQPIHWDKIHVYHYKITSRQIYSYKLHHNISCCRG
eukprot:196653_1